MQEVGSQGWYADSRPPRGFLRLRRNGVRDLRRRDLRVDPRAQAEQANHDQDQAKRQDEWQDVAERLEEHRPALPEVLHSPAVSLLNLTESLPGRANSRSYARAIPASVVSWIPPAARCSSSAT